MGPHGWAVPGFPHQPQEPPTITTVENAMVTRMKRGHLRTLQRPDRWITGAVHDSRGLLVRESQKLGGLGGNQLVAADPDRVKVRAGADRLTGTWLYGGHWINHFGHFFTETLTTLWPRPPQIGAPEDFDGVLFHAYGHHTGTPMWAGEFYALTRWAGRPVHVVTTTPVRVDRLVVPSRSVVVNGWAFDGARDVWDELVTAVGGTPVLDPAGPRVYLSRTGFNARRVEEGAGARTDPERDRGLDACFTAAGFEVVEPETLSIPEQIRLASGASVLAGCAGTALHLSAFAPAGVRVLEIGDTRSPDVQVPQQLVVDTLREHPSAFVPHAVPTAQMPEVLAGLGL